MVCTPNKPEHARSRLDLDYNKMKEKYIGKHQTRNMKTLPGSLNLSVLDGYQKQAIRNVTRLQNCLPDKLNTFCKKHLQTLLDLDSSESQEMFDDSDKVVKRKISTPFSSKKKHKTATTTALSKDTAAPIYKLISYIQTETDLKMEGLFRKTGNIGRQRQLKEQIQHGLDTDLQDGHYTAHDVATVLKQMISDLPQPLVTEKFFKGYLQIGAMLKTDETGRGLKKKLKAIQLMMVMLPQENAQLLKQLLDLLYRVAMIPDNKMTASSLGIVFAPSLLCPRNLSAGNMHADSVVLSCVVSAMIDNAPHVFDFPQELIEDVNQFWKNMENSTTEEITKQDITSVSEVNSDDLGIDSVSNKTQMVLAKLYAHLRAMPQSAKKKKMLKQKTSVKQSNIEVSVNLVKSKRLSKSLKQDFPTMIKVNQQGQSNLIEQVSQSCMDLDKMNCDIPSVSTRVGTPYNMNKLNFDKPCAGSQYNMKALVSRQKNSPAVCIVDLDASPYFTKPRQYWSYQNLDTVKKEPVFSGSEQSLNTTAKDTLCRTLFIDSPIYEETVTIPCPISKSINSHSVSSSKAGSRAPVLIFQSPINKLTESFI